MFNNKISSNLYDIMAQNIDFYNTLTGETGSTAYFDNVVANHITGTTIVGPIFSTQQNIVNSKIQSLKGLLRLDGITTIKDIHDEFNKKLEKIDSLAREGVEKEIQNIIKNNDPRCRAAQRP